MILLDAAADETLDQKISKYCAPLFATDRFLRGGHSESSTNATVTFIKFQDRYWAVTCHHVLSAFWTETVKKRLKLVPSIHSGRSIQQFGSMVGDGQYRWSFNSSREFADAQTILDFRVDDDTEQSKAAEQALNDLAKANAHRTDIALADITLVWPALTSLTNARAVDLDAWLTPNWDIMQQHWIVFGYPNHHKSRELDKVGAQFTRVTARIESPPTPDKSTFTLCSTLDAPHRYGFSGVSGGPVVMAHQTEDKIAFVGLAYEGAPSSTEANPAGFITGTDIFIMGYHLTPDNFRHWMSELKYGIQL